MYSLDRDTQIDVTFVAHAQFDDGGVDDYSDLPPMSDLAQQHSRQRPFCPSGLRDDGYTPSLHGQV